MNLKSGIASVALGIGLIAMPSALLAQYPQGPPPPPPQGAYGQQGPYGQQGGWDAPPAEFTRDIQRQGFHDGIEGARRDFENHRPPNVRNRDEFRNYRGAERRVYRDAFRRGYQVAWSHMGNGFDRDRDRDHDHDHDRDHY